MQDKPLGWPVEGDVETLPEIFLELHGSSWPPARGDVPQGTAEVGAWSVSQQLTGSALPGQVRAVSGHSIPSGSVSFAQPEGAPLTPWARGPLNLGPGGACTLYASHAGVGRSHGLRLGGFQLAPIAGSSLSNTVELELDGDPIRMQKPFTLRWRYNTKVSSFAEPPYELDASWVIDQVARSTGYYQTPALVTSAFLSLPLCGGTMADRGSTITATVAGWVAAEHQAGLGPGSSIDASLSTTVPNKFYISCDVAGAGGRIIVGGAVFDFSSTKLEVRSGITTLATVAYPVASGAIRRVQAEVTRTGNSLAVRVRCGAGAWSAGATAAFGSAPWDSGTDTATIDTTLTPTGRWIRGIQLHTVDDPRIWIPPNAQIDIAYSPIHAAFGIEKVTAWEVVQDIAAKTMGAAWVTPGGVLVYRNGERMRGTDAPVETVEALDKLEDLAWVIDPGEIADRVEVTYTPTDVETSYGMSTLWESTETIRVPARKTVTVYADINGTTNVLSPFVPLWPPTDPAVTKYVDGRMSRWAAATSPDGSGVRPADNAIRVSAQMVGVSRAKISITNATGGTLWLVDGTGAPCLILRTSLHIAPGEPETISHGPAIEDALNPISLDAGAWVQDATAAQRILDWLVGQTATAKAVINSVRVKPDLSREIGDVIRLTDGHTGLRTEAIISGITLAGDSTGYTQHLDLALLDVAYQDFDAWLERESITTFADFDTWLTANNITTFEDFDQWAIDLGGTW